MVCRLSAQWIEVWVICAAVLTDGCTRTGFEGAVDSGPLFDLGEAADAALDTAPSPDMSPFVDAPRSDMPPVLGTGGAVSLVPAPPSVQNEAWESDTAIRVFAERQGVTLANGLALDIDAPGDYSQFSSLGVKTAPAGATVNSYMAHVDPVGKPSSSLSFAGSITFTAPILGLILQANQLTASDPLLGAPATSYPGQSRGVDDTEDFVHLSADRRTLVVHLIADIHVDEIRIVLDAGP